MTQRKQGLLLPLIILCIFASFGLQSHNRKVETDMTEYYWYDAWGNYLWRQNTIDDEISLTGYDMMLNNPKTLREKGYAPPRVSGFPPVPTSPYNPDKKLYSHP
jgi:hypothetical protein